MSNRKRIAVSALISAIVMVGFLALLTPTPAFASQGSPHYIQCTACNPNYCGDAPVVIVVDGEVCIRMQCQLGRVLYICGLIRN